MELYRNKLERKENIQQHIGTIEKSQILQKHIETYGIYISYTETKKYIEVYRHRLKYIQTYSNVQKHIETYISRLTIMESIKKNKEAY